MATARIWLRRVVVLAIAGVSTLAAVIIAVNFKILEFQQLQTTVESAPTSSVIIVFGGGMQDTGEQSIFQSDRVVRGVELYKLGKAPRIIMTGDDGGNHDDEVHAMRLQAIKLGVPKEAVSIDPHGYRTYESCWRERFVYGIDDALVISQSFHVPRMLYLCRGMGIAATGVSADLSNYGWPLVKAEVREMLARVKAWWQLEVVMPLPRNLEK